MTITQIEEAYSDYLNIESQLTDVEKMRYLKGFQELIKLFKLNVELEKMSEEM